MNVSAEFKLEPPFKVLNVRFVWILTRDDDLLRLEVLDVGDAAVGELDGADAGGDAGDGGDGGAGHGAAREVDYVGHGLLARQGHRPQRELHHLPRQQLGPVRYEQSAQPLAAEGAHSQGFRVICRLGGNKYLSIC